MPDEMDTAGKSQVSSFENGMSSLTLEPTAEETSGITTEEPPPERELSQTDHLNKSLLTSFLARLNNPNSAFPLATQASDEAQQSHPSHSMEGASFLHAQSHPPHSQAENKSEAHQDKERETDNWHQQ